jgi:hypothetical protein
MTAPPVIPAYCGGPPGEPHARFIVAAYRRAHAIPTPAPALWTPLREFNGMRLHGDAERVLQHPDGSHWLQFHLWCEQCPFDGQYNAEPGGVVFAVLDARWFSGRDAIEVRELDRVCRSQAAHD